MSDDLEQCSIELEQLKRDMRFAQANPKDPAARLLMLVVQKSLQQLRHHMRQKQGAIRKKLSHATQANQAASAYSNVINFSKKKS